ncbi:MAG: protein kinase, partial [Thermoanaerobaculia bacterium]|nr:protein kinase [Thermoanaerobaculia bacterium]
MTLEKGRRLGPYEILSPIGAGGMGEVYEAKDTRLNRTVAIKVLPEGLAENPERRARFEREARTVSQLSHPHVCTLHDVGEEQGLHFLVMEHLEGETLAERLESGALPLEETLRYGAQIAEALDAAHRQGVIHRDLKPANVMLTDSGVKLLDFGLARVASAGAGGMADLPTIEMEAGRTLTEEGALLGTFPYMSPEQVEGGQADARSDVFALGAVLYEMATGRRAFGGESAASVMSAVLRDHPEPPSQVQPVSPAALDHVVSRCLAKDPEDRWQSAKDIAWELRWISDADSRNVSPAPVLKHSPVREWLGWSLFGVALIAVLLLWWLPATPEDAPTNRPVTFGEISIPEGLSAGVGLQGAISRDGSRIVLALYREGARSLFVRDLDSREFRALQGTEGATRPFFSPDGEWIGYFDAGDL